MEYRTGEWLYESNRTFDKDSKWRRSAK
jgi:hypothetical protein